MKTIAVISMKTILFVFIISFFARCAEGEGKDASGKFEEETTASSAAIDSAEKAGKVERMKKII